MKVLIVEENIHFGRGLKQLLETNLHRVTLTDDKDVALKLAYTNQYDILLMSAGFIKCDCKAFVKHFRHQGFKTPIIAFSNHSYVAERIDCLNQGVDDYMDQATSPEEVLSRVMALMRRVNHRYTQQYQVGGLLFDASLCHAETQFDALSLTPKESRMLEYLIINQNIALPKEQLVSQVWGNTHEFNYNLVEVCISYLRKKLKQLGGSLRIQTIRNQGYVLKVQETKGTLPEAYQG